MKYKLSRSNNFKRSFKKVRMSDEEEESYIEPIEKSSSDYLAVQEAIAENNPSYSIEETRKHLGL
ncbi:MAG: hypothetical protein KAU90_06420 [Sulfurovaceae bacterium]|nr:hypothetical protein [Sulfurovaceae bacterium]